MKYHIGVELGVVDCTAGVVDKYGRMIRKETQATFKDRPYEEIIADIAELIKNILEREDIDIKSVKYIGVGCPGIPNKKDGTIIRSYTLGFHNTPVRSELQKYFHMPIFVENSSNCAALAESVSGAAEDIDFSVTIKIGNGIGCGIIVNNKIYSGFNFAGAEPGHMVIDIGGEPCACGRKGCWETYASASALIKQTRTAAELHPDSLINTGIEGDCSRITVITAFEAAKLGDAVAIEVVGKYLEYLGEGIVNIINIIMPEAIIISGEISKLGETLLKPLREIVNDRIYSKDITTPEIKTAELGSAAIVIGAAMLGM
jgi:glucokinase